MSVTLRGAPPPTTPLPSSLRGNLLSLYKASIRVPIIGPCLPGRPEFMFEMQRPNFRFDPNKKSAMTGWNQGRNMKAVAPGMVERIVTTIAQADAGQGSSKDDLFKDVTVAGRRYDGQMKISDFMTLSSSDQMKVIDQAWEKLCVSHAYDKRPGRMFEPADTTIPATVDPVPSGMVPDGAGYKCGWLDHGGRPSAFCSLGVGFRVEGSGQNADKDIKRVLENGMSAQIKNVGLMRDIKGWAVQGTIVQRQTNVARVWTTKHDIFNESAVCVSRNFYGATAFPMRDSGQGGAEVAVLWAVDCSGLMGFDTEDDQLGRPNSRNWRPGEKAFARVPRSNVIGYVKIERNGEPEGGRGGWIFTIPSTASWKLCGDWATVSTFVPSPRLDKINYIEGQLKAWQKDSTRHVISGAYDFAT